MNSIWYRISFNTDLVCSAKGILSICVMIDHKPWSQMSELSSLSALTILKIFKLLGCIKWIGCTKTDLNCIGVMAKCRVDSVDNKLCIFCSFCNSRLCRMGPGLWQEDPYALHVTPLSEHQIMNLIILISNLYLDAL